MGSNSDWPTMRKAAELLAEFGIEYDAQVVSAHRTPDAMYDFAKQAEATRNGCSLDYPTCSWLPY